MSAADRMTITSKDWTESAGGAAALILGLFVAWQAAHGRALLPGSASVPQTGVPLGILLAGAGILLLLWCEGRTIDRARRRVTAWRGPLVGLRRQVYDLSRFDAVRVGLRRVGSGAGPSGSVEFVVVLCGCGDSLLVSRHATHHEARIQAEEIAAFADLELRDSVRAIPVLTRRAAEAMHDGRRPAEPEEEGVAIPALSGAR